MKSTVTPITGPCDACAAFAGGNPCVHTESAAPTWQEVSRVIHREPGSVRFAQAMAYAWGHNDASNIPIPKGSADFATAYAMAYAEFDRGTPGRSHMKSIGGHYFHWLRTSGASIWDDGE